MSKIFNKHQLAPRVFQALSNLGFKRPTEVQQQVIPYYFEGINLIVEAPTGTGKTAAYGLPMLSQLNLQKRSTQALILAPTRELVLQIEKALQSYYDGNQLKVGSVVGGKNLKESEALIRSSPHVVVASPGRLKDVMSRGKLDFFWRDIRHLIIDEGDKLMEKGFQQEFENIKSRVRGKAHTCFFSATISEDAELMMREHLRTSKVIRIHPKNTLKKINFGFVEVDKGQRSTYLAALLQQESIKQALIFCSKRQEIQTVNAFLRKRGLKSEAYYGSLTQEERKSILDRFSKGHISYLVASDLAARGLDIPKLEAVINLAIPSNYDFYLHRSGRTGRAGKKGKVFNLVSSGVALIRLENHHKKLELPLKPFHINLESAKLLKVVTADKWEKYQLSRGKRDKIRKGDIVGFLVNNTSLEVNDIGTITIYDHYSIVDIPVRGYLDLEYFPDLKIKNKSVKLRKFSLTEQSQKAVDSRAKKWKKE